MSEKYRVAFLGPEGSYSHQAADNVFGSTAIYVPKKTIGDAFHAVSPEIPYAVIPHENSTFGNVVETYDLFRTDTLGIHAQLEIVGETQLSIQHCLLVKKGTVKTLADITHVLSHEQALGQCQRFLSKHLPNAKRIKISSTSYAVQRVLGLDKQPDDEPGIMAAISPGLCYKLYPGKLDMLAEGMQDVQENYTRFLVLCHTSLAKRPSTFKNALLQLSHSATSRTRPDLSPLFDAISLRKTRVLPRPSLVPVPYHDVYFIQVECTNFQALEETKRKVEKVGWSCTLLGTW